MDWTPANRTDVTVALARIPAGSFLLTSAYGDQRGGVPVKWVQQCCENPPMVMVAVEKGHPLSPVIRDSRCFAVCQLDPADRASLRTFEQQQPGMDPFVGVVSTSAPSGAPVPGRAIAFADCELARHVDIDGDHEIYMGVVHHAQTLRDPENIGHCLCGETPRPAKKVASATSLRGIKVRASIELARLNGTAPGTSGRTGANGHANGGGRANGSGRSSSNGRTNGSGRTNGTHEPSSSRRGRATKRK